jgi:hypothetical protein
MSSSSTSGYGSSQTDSIRRVGSSGSAMHRAEDAVAVQLQLAPVGLGELAKRLLVARARPCEHGLAQRVAPHELLAIGLSGRGHHG